MPEDLHREFDLREPAERRRWSAFELIVLGTLTLMLLATGLQFFFLRDTKDYQGNAEQRGYQNRAAICEIQRDLGVTLDEICLSDNVTVYYDPNARHTANGAAIRRMLCQILAQRPNREPTFGVDCAGTGVR